MLHRGLPRLDFDCLKISNKQKISMPAGATFQFVCKYKHRGKTESGPMMSSTNNVSTVFNISH